MDVFLQDKAKMERCDLALPCLFSGAVFSGCTDAERNVIKGLLVSVGRH